LVVIAIIAVLIALLLPAVQSAREAARRAQCTNNLKQLGLAVHNYHTTYNAIPAEGMWMGATNQGRGGSWGWNASWPVCLLPNLEQNPLFNSYNSAWSPDQPENSSVSYNAIGTLLCPSDAQRQRPNYPWAPMNYAGNSGGPACIHWQDGTIVDMFTCSTTNQVPINGWPVGTCWWSANANFAYFGLEGVTDGASNTALFSEHLLGYAAGTQGNQPTAGDVNARRGLFFPAGIPDYTIQDTGNQAAALAGVQICKGIPGPTVSKAGWWIGFSWTLSFPWHIPTNRYTHYNTPNGLTCINATDQCCGYGGTGPMITATSNHPAGVNVCFTDGSVRFVKDSVSPNVWWAIGSRNIGETLSSGDY